jgi:threonine dehydratase
VLLKRFDEAGWTYRDITDDPMMAEFII